MKRLLRGLVEALRGFARGLAEAAREQAREALELQERELETLFYTLALAPPLGIPLAPLGVALEAAEVLEEELPVAVNRAALWADALADYFSSLGGEW